MAFPDFGQHLSRGREGYYEMKDGDGWQARIGIEQTDLWANDNEARELPPYRGAFPNFCIDGHPVVEGDDPMRESFPGLNVHSYALVVPQQRLITLGDSQGAPFWMNFNGTSRGALVVSLKGMNPLTLNPASAVLEYEEIDAWGKKAKVQPWIPLGIAAGKDWLDGFPTDPVRMHDEDAAVRQGIFTTNPRLGVAGYFIPPEERKRTLSFLFFRPKIWEPPAIRKSAYRDSLSFEGAPETLSYGATRALDDTVQVAAGGLIRQKVQRDSEGPGFYQPEPRVLLRYYPVTEEQGAEIKASMPRRRDVMGSMDLPTFGGE